MLLELRADRGVEDLAPDEEDQHGSNGSRHDDPQDAHPEAEERACGDGEDRFGKEDAGEHDEDQAVDERAPEAQ